MSKPTFFDTIKAFFKYSETIFLARLSIFGGFIYAALMGIDWSQIASLDLSHGFDTAALYEAGKWIVMGVLAEAARRRNANL